MATLSEFNVEVQHISGSCNLPSDFLSRNPLECESQNCQLCKFISECEASVVCAVSVKDVLGGLTAVPFCNRTAWKNLQMECSDLRRVHAHLTNGTRPTAKNTKVGVVKRFLRNVTIARDGLLIVFAGIRTDCGTFGFVARFSNLTTHYPKPSHCSSVDQRV